MNRTPSAGVRRRQIFGLALGGAGIASAAAQDPAWPSRSIRMIVPFAPGGTADLVARLLADRMPAELGQPVVVENRPGAGATLGASFVAQARPDGYTLLYCTPGPQIINSYLMRRLPYDPWTAFAPVVSIMRAPNVLVVHPSLPVRSVPELIALAKREPGRVSFASSGIGSSIHLAGELFKTMAGVDILHVPFRGSGESLQALLSGTVQMAIDTVSSMLPQIRAGGLRALGVSTLAPSEVLPDVPTIAATLPGFEASPFNYVTGPAGLPEPVIQRLNLALNAILRQPDFRTVLRDQGIEPVGGTPEALQATIVADAARWREVMERAGIRPE
jgi:tripartite-type tricarboxylate transporter receptor subunit TctC